MWEKKVISGKYSVHLKFHELPFAENEDSFFFGYSFNFQDKHLNLPAQENVDNLKGHWFKTTFSNDKIEITTDLFSGFRLYYVVLLENVFISDKYETLLSKLPNRTIQNHEYTYYQRHNYTTGGQTFIDGIKKISPSSSLIIDKGFIAEKLHFQDLNRRSNLKYYIESIHLDLNDTFQNIEQLSKKTILLFSGGKDSCLLLNYLLKSNINFTPVFINNIPQSKNGQEDLLKVKSVSRKLNISIDIIDIKCSEASEELLKDIAQKQVFDRHFSLVFYLGIKEIKSKYGEDIVLINGQSSDNIFSFGPSEHSIMSYFRRYILYKPNHFISKAGLVLLMLKTRKRFVLPKTEQEKLIGILDDYKYTRVLDKTMSQDYYDYLIDYIKAKTSHLNSFYSKEMYLRIASYLQGSDNKVVLNSAEYNGVKHIIMPFATPQMVYSSIEFKDENLELKSPKYIVGQLLVHIFSFDFKEILKTPKDKKTASNFNTLSQIESKVFDHYDKRIDQIVKTKKM